MSWPPYPEHRNSGVEWLGDVPSEWTISPLKYTARVLPSNVDKHSNDGETPVRLCNYTDVYYNDQIDGKLDFMQATATTDEIRKFSLRQGDTIFTKDSETADDIGQSAYVPESLDGVLCGYHLSVVRPSERLIGRFAKRLFDSHYLRAVMEVSANGLTRVGLSQCAIDNLDVPLPPVEEQEQIADFLDAETASIDALIRNQEQLIATLREDRAATVARVITKGLNSEPELKDSGIEWLGEICASWSVSALKHHFTVVLDKMLQREYRVEGDCLQPYLRAAHLPPTGFTTHDAKQMWFSPIERRELDLRRGDVVVVEGGVGGYGRCDVIPEDLPGWGFEKSINRLRPRDGSSGAFVKYVLHTARDRGFMAAICSVSTMPHLTAEKLGDMRIPVPPVHEQRDLVEFLDERCRKIELLITKATEMIETLREYRSALITDAVTGKIDVRGTA
jgi:type I restriction enzyme, S subunit